MTGKTQAKKLQDTFVESAHKIWLAGLGALATGQEEGSKLFSTLVERGASFEARGKKNTQKDGDAGASAKKIVKSYWDTLGKTFEEKLTAVMHKTGVPTKREIDALSDKVDQLTEAIEKLQKKASPTRRGPAKRTSPASKKTSSSTTTTGQTKTPK